MLEGGERRARLKEEGEKLARLEEKGKRRAREVEEFGEVNYICISSNGICVSIRYILVYIGV